MISFVVRLGNKSIASDKKRGQVRIRKGVSGHLFQTSQRGMPSQDHQRNVRFFEEGRMWFKRYDVVQVGVTL